MLVEGALVEHIDRWVGGTRTLDVACLTSGGLHQRLDVCDEIQELRLEHRIEREREVLALMAEGRSNKAIAERLLVADHTVEKHVKNIFGTLRPAPSGDERRRVLAVVRYPSSH